MSRQTLFILTLACSLVVTVPVKAQFFQGYGIRGGGNESNITGYLDDLFEPTRSFQVAVFAEFFKSEVFSFQAELEYARRGYSMTQEATDGSGQSLGTVRGIYGLDYLSIPVLVRLRFSGRSKVIPYVMAGPRLDILFNSRPGVWKYPDGTWKDESMSDVFAGFGLSGSVGFGIAFEQVIRKELRVEVRYNFSMTDLMPDLDEWTVRRNEFDISVAVVL